MVKVYPHIAMRNTLSARLIFFAAILPFARAADPIAELPSAYQLSLNAYQPTLSTYQPGIQETLPPRPISASWKWSLAPLAASQGLDIASSYGMRELNPLLAGPQDQFGVKATLLKVGITGALVGAEYLIVKAHPGVAKIFTKINWSGAALTTGFAAHNWAIR